MHRKLNRRDFVQNSVLATTGVAAAAGLPERTGAAETKAAAPAPKPLLPTGKLGELRFTRLILGGNLLTR
jgi:hypothetical protein